MTGRLRPPGRPRIAVAVLRSIGSRLTQAERPPYEIPEHDRAVELDDPTGDLIESQTPPSGKKPS